MVPEAEDPDRRQSVVVQKDLCVWDALASARRGEAADAAHPRQGRLGDADAGKLAGRERDVQERDASCLQAHRSVLSAQQGAGAALCTRGAAQFAEQSCAVQAAAADQQPPVVRLGVAEWVRSEVQKKQRPKAAQERMAQLSGPWAVQDVAAEAQPQAPVRKRRPRAFPQAQIQLEAAVQARVLTVRRAVARQLAEQALRPEAQQLRAWPRPEAQAQDEPVAPQRLPSFE